MSTVPMPAPHLTAAHQSDLITGTGAFPVGFTWGAATSSFQIEGATTADGRGESIWDRFCAQPGAIADNTDGEGPAQHYVRWPEDVDLLKQLHLSAYRFSIAWPRVQPTGTGAPNGAGLDFYDRLVDGLLEQGISPYPTLYHWDLPQALQDVGGWTSRETAHAFAEYAHIVAERLGDRVTHWTTLNEPFVSADHGYRRGEHAPGHTSTPESLSAAHHLLLAHGLATRRIRSVSPDLEVGIVLNFTPVQPRSQDPADIARAAAVHDWENRWYVEPISGRPYPPATAASMGWRQEEVAEGDLDIISQPLDFLGVNFYTRQIVAGDLDWRHEPERATDMGWEIHPESLGRLLQWLNESYGFPRFMITENGAAMPDTARLDGRVDDQDRIGYLHEHLHQLAAAIEAGVPVTHYFVWSLLDNFEWAHGYRKTFGIVEVDPESGDRIPKSSALWLSEVAQANALPAPNRAGEET